MKMNEHASDEGEEIVEAVGGRPMRSGIRLGLVFRRRFMSGLYRGNWYYVVLR